MLLRERKTGSDGIFCRQSLQLIVGEAHRIADTACRDRHGAHRAARVIVRITVGVRKAAARRTCHTAGVLRHAALAVVGIVRYHSNGISHVRVQRTRSVKAVVIVAHKNRSADLDLRHVAKPVAPEGIRLICRCNYSGIFRFSLTGYVFPLFPVKLTRNPFSILNL